MNRMNREQMAARVARDIPDGAYVNLGVGLPTLVANHLPKEREIVLHSENGLLGMGAAPAAGREDPDLINASKQPVTLLPGGAFFHQADSFGMMRGGHLDICVLGMGPAPAPGEEDYDLINAGKQPVTILPGACYFHHADSFGMMRGGHLDFCVLGAFQVSVQGDLANWHTGAADAIPAVGGAMDLAIGAKQVYVMMEHLTKEGRSKIVERCTYPLTSIACVDRIYTDLAVIDVTPKGLLVREIVEGVSFEALSKLTGVPLLREPAQAVA